MVDYKKLKVAEIRSELVALGIDENSLQDLVKKELIEMHQNTVLEQSIEAIDLNSDFEEIEDGLPGTDAPDVIDDSTPDRFSPEWHDYVMSKFNSNELIDGNPITAGLRRVTEVVLGEITSTGPTKVFPAQDPNGPGRATVVYEVIIREYATGNIKRYADTADVWHGNTDDLFCAHPVATAKKDIVEIVQQTTARPTDGDWNPQEKISVQQVSFIDTKCRQLDIDVANFINSGTDAYKNINEINKDTASKMIKQLNNYQNGEADIPAAITSYKPNWRG